MAVEIDLNALMSSQSFWERAGYVGFVIVIIGVVGEGVHDLTNWGKRTRWGPYGGRLSVLVLVVGLALEGIAQINGNNSSAQIIAFLGDQEAMARLEAANIKKQLAWREVTPQQFASIRRALQSTHMQVTISWVAGDPEGSAFARQLAEAFGRSGVVVSAFAPMGFLGQEPHGLSISGSERDEVQLLASALSEAGLGPPSVEISGRKADGSKYSTHLLVGYRSPPMLSR